MLPLETVRTETLRTVVPHVARLGTQVANLGPLGREKKRGEKRKLKGGKKGGGGR